MARQRKQSKTSTARYPGNGITTVICPACSHRIELPKPNATPSGSTPTPPKNSRKYSEETRPLPKTKRQIRAEERAATKQLDLEDVIRDLDQKA